LSLVRFLIVKDIRIDENYIVSSMKKTTGILIFLCSLLAISRSQAQCTIPDTLFSSDTLIVCNDTITQLNVTPLTGVTYAWSNPEGSGNSLTVTRNGKYRYGAF
jgi:hypothetical protein